MCEEIHSRVEPGPLLHQYHRSLEDIDSVMAKCCRKLLEPNPSLRMSARKAENTLAPVVAAELAAQNERSRIEIISVVIAKKARLE